MTVKPSTVASNPTSHGAHIHKDLLALARHSPDLKVLPTLLPSHIAHLITNFAASTRTSLRLATYIIETLLSTSQFSTRASLTYSRHFLISALSFARHAHTYPLYLSPPGGMGTDAFVLALDKYTALGIHLVQHTFSLVELFTMSGFYITASAVQTAHHAAQESVTLLEGLFGSTQSSRALAAVIEMVRRELDMDDKRSKTKQKGEGQGQAVSKHRPKGFLGGLRMLTRAITAFACLQVATWERTCGKSKMISVHEYTVHRDGLSKRIQPKPEPKQPISTPSPAAQYLISLTPDTAAAVPFGRPPTRTTNESPLLNAASSHTVSPSVQVEPVVPVSPERPKRKRGYTSVESHPPYFRSPEHSLAPSPRRNMKPLYLRSRSLDLSQDVQAISALTELLRRDHQPNSDLKEVDDVLNSTVQSNGRLRRNTGKALAVTEVSPVSTLARSIPNSTGTIPSVSASMEPSSNGRIALKDASAPSDSLAFQDCFPRRHLLQNLHRFMRYSNAAYGQMFLRVFGTESSDYSFFQTKQHDPNSWSFARYTDIPMDCLLLTSYVDASPMSNGHKAPPLMHYVAVDHAAEAIVLTCRGTLGLSDVLVDLTCEYVNISVPHTDQDEEHYVHQGMYEAALGLCAPGSRVHRTISSALAQYPNYGLVMCGHSLGGGVAALLALLTAVPWSMYRPVGNSRNPADHFVTSIESGLPPGRRVHCYAYGPPAVMSPDLARHCRGLVTSVIQDTDIVPSLSLGVLRDLKNIAVTMAEEKGIAEEIFRKVMGIKKKPPANEQDQDEVQMTNDWLFAMVKTLRADMQNDKLYPPGDVYIMEVHDTFAAPDGAVMASNQGPTAKAHRAVLRKCLSVEERFREPIFSRTMLNDHLPSNYERSTSLLLKGMLQNETSE